MDIKLIENNVYITPSSKHDLVAFEEVDIDNMNCVRIFPARDPESVHVQLRAKQALKGRQKKRNMVATVKFSVEELEQILAVVKEHMVQEPEKT